ncbi:Thermophilic serine proteinase [bacterium HR32]|nr:Thermophilic serine proteinase [bacterium HR32]
MRRATLLVVLALVASGCGSGPVRVGGPPPGSYVPGEVVVKYLSGVQPTAAEVAAVRGAVLRRGFRARVAGGEFNLALVRVPEGQEAAYIEQFQRRPEVVYAEYNFRVRRLPVVAASGASGRSVAASRPSLRRQGTLDWTTVTDPKLTECDPAFQVTRLNGQTTQCTDTDRSASWQWDLWRMRVPEAWELADGAGVVVAVVDEGVDASHPEFAGQLELPASGCQTDTVDGDYDPSDTGGHGTHVAGTVAAAANGAGVVGVAPRARILPVRVLGPLGGTVFSVATGIVCAVEHGARVLNLSLGSPAYSRALEDAVRTATDGGAVVVMAAGNEFQQGNPRTYPAAFAETVRGAVGVGASAPDDRVASFSSSGPWVTVVAPGTTVYSTLPVSQGSYGFLQGTSMASPHVAGVAALVLSRKPSLTPAQVRNLLETTAFPPCPGYPRPDYSGAGTCGTYSPQAAGSYGWGVVDARAAVEATSP